MTAIWKLGNFNLWHSTYSLVNSIIPVFTVFLPQPKACSAFAGLPSNSSNVTSTINCRLLVPLHLLATLLRSVFIGFASTCAHAFLPECNGSYLRPLLYAFWIRSLNSGRVDLYFLRPLILCRVVNLIVLKQHQIQLTSKKKRCPTLL